MGMIFVGQTALKLSVTVGVDITGATCKIKYKKPDKSTGEFSATIIDAAAGVIEYVFTDETKPDKRGEWIFWGFVTFENGKIAAGESYSIYIYREGQTRN